MNERIIISQIANLAQTRDVKVTKPPVDQSLILDLTSGAKLGLSAGAQFAQVPSISEDPSGLPKADDIPPSGADFHDVTIGRLGGGLAALPLLAPEDPSGHAVFSVDHSAIKHANAVSPVPSVTIPAPGGPATVVFEAGLLASRGPGESAGSHPGQPSFPTTTRAGTISFNSPDGLQSVFLGGHQLTTSAQTFADGTIGSLTASYTFNTATGKGTISYSYTLLDNTLSAPNTSFAVVVTDRDGHNNPPANLVINIVDDAPIARADSDGLTSGLTTAVGNVLDGSGTTSGPAGTDVRGADGGVTVVSIASGATIKAVDPINGVTIQGTSGTLTISATGAYTYTHTLGGGADVFTYTIRDADGSLSHTTLTINLNDSAPTNIVIPQPGGLDTQVFEAGLAAARGPGESAGSHPGQPSFPTSTQTGAVTFISVDGVSKIELGGNVVTATSAQTAQTFADGTRGQLSAWFEYNSATGAGAIHYTYRLLDNTLGNPLVNNGDTSASFAVAVTDADGDRTAGGNLIINIVDDKPAANPDHDNVVAGQTAAEAGNVLGGSGTVEGTTNADVAGADGGLSVVGVVSNNTNTVGTVGMGLHGAFGTLTIDAGGNYSYVRDTGVAGGPNHNDTFTYTVKDADGSQSTATLTIAVADSTPSNLHIPVGGDAGTQVFEAGLPAARGPGESAGSDPAAATATTGSITFTSVDGVGSIKLVDSNNNTITVDSQSRTFIDPNGVYSLAASYTIDAAGNGTITYTYTLLDNTNAQVNPNTTFAVTVTDKDGESTSGTLVIAVQDDGPAANLDSNTVLAGQTTASGTVLGNDVLGADGAPVSGAVVSVVSNNTNTVGTVGAVLQGGFGTLTLFADGTYSYVRDQNTPGNVSDVFTYTIKDADGTTSAPVTLTINIGDSVPTNLHIPQPGDAGTQVFEAGLPAARGPGESAGSNPAAATATTGSITFTSVDGVGSIKLVDSNNNTITLDTQSRTFIDPNGVYSLAASYTIDAAGNGTITYTYTLLDNTDAQVNPNTSFAVTVTDKDGESTNGTLVIAIQDDKPVANADHDNVAAGQATAETGSVLDGTGTVEGTTNADISGADGGVSVVGIVSNNTNTVGTVGTALHGAFGTLTIDAGGHYSYVRDTGVAGGPNNNDTFTYTVKDSDGSQSTATLTIAVADSAPADIAVPGPDRGETTVFEAGLPARPGEPAGSNPVAPVTTDEGIISFTSLDGVSKIELGGLALTAPDTEQSVSDATGTLTAFYTYDATTGLGEIHYHYTLIDNTVGDPSSVSFAVAVTDADGDRATGNDLVINIVDDQPTAQSDVDVVVAGQTTPETGNVLDGSGTASGDSGADVLGADGATLVGIAAGDSNGNPVSGGVGTQIQGDHGILTIDAQGNYSYTRTGGSGVDVFSYTIQDGDGDVSTATLAITIGDSVPTGLHIPQPGDAGTQVSEAGLLASRGAGESAGSDAGNPDGQAPTATTGTVTFNSADGIGTIKLIDNNNPNNTITLDSGNPSQTFIDPNGVYSLQASYTIDAAGNGTITYTYTLLDNTDARITPNASFAVTVTDPDGDSTSGALAIAIHDDSPTAVADANTVAAGQTTASGTVLANDVFGADGKLPNDAVVSVVSNNTSAIGTVGTGLHGAFGTLTLSADGTYNYVRDGNSPGGVTDVFTYTIKDTDGSLAQNTLSVTLADSTPSIALSGPAGTVFEAGLPAGSHAGNPSFGITASDTIIFSSLDGVRSVSLAGHVLNADGTAQTIADGTMGSLTAFYTFDTATHSGAIHFDYHLLQSTPGFPSTSFAIAVTDLDNDSNSSSFLTINIEDDVPAARNDDVALAVVQGTASGNVMTGLGTVDGLNGIGADTQGADGAHVFGVASGVRTAAVVGGVGAVIGGTIASTSLILNPDGSFTFNGSGLPQGGFEFFTYTIRDGDGQLSTAIITFTRDDGGNIVSESSSSSIDASQSDLGGGAAANHFLLNAPSEGGSHILDFKHGIDSIDVLLAGFAGLSGKGAVASSDFVASNNAATANLGAAHFAYNASNGQLFYDSNGGDASGASRMLLAILDNHTALAATDIHKV